MRKKKIEVAAQASRGRLEGSHPTTNTTCTISVKQLETLWVVLLTTTKVILWTTIILGIIALDLRDTQGIRSAVQPSYKLSKYIASVISPQVGKTSSHILNSKHFAVMMQEEQGAGSR